MHRRLLLLTTVLNLFGCSSFNPQETTFNVLQNMRQQSCEEQGGVNCPTPESYRKYEQRRKEVVKEE